ncbi:MAG: MBOAT family protein [Lachnospiraceae bacterium]|nr:MBOAT family protein [Lachnospiraceae bacterium]
MEYHLLTYSLLFLPAVVILYQLVQKRYRFIVLLAADYIFFWMVSKWLIVYLFIATLATYGTGRVLDYVSEHSSVKGKQLTKRKRCVLAAGIFVTLGMLVIFKYLKVFGITLLAPIGISYYTLQTISYMTDVYRGTVKADKNLARTALYLSFFPQIMEGPISRYSETAESLFSGSSIEYNNLVYGYQRILWGLFKKMMVADRLAPVIFKIFGDYERYDGSAVTVAVICYTFQLYTEFSGGMDIILGSGEIFGVKLPENFRQPFFADSAGDFWRRWHITLGTWLKDYIFYPISLAKPVKKLAKKVKGVWGINVSKFVAPTIALFFVWLSNGIWHGAGWTYLFYGMYYFVLIFLENITEAPRKKWIARMHINTEKIGWRLLTGVKLFVIINLGEMFFRAETVAQGFGMLGKICTDFHISVLKEADIGLDKYDIILAVASLFVVFLVDIIHEKGISIRNKVASFKMPLRWSFWYAVIFLIVIFGAYGAGYTIVDMIYAAY